MDVINPLTKRKIKFNGKTHRKLIHAGILPPISVEPDGHEHETVLIDPAMLSHKSKKYECTDLITYPQYSGTCWFNAIITILFYSDRMRLLVDRHLREKPASPLYDTLRRFLKPYEKKDMSTFQEQIPKPKDLIQMLYNEYPYIIRFNPYLTRVQKMADLMNVQSILYNKLYPDEYTCEGFYSKKYIARIMNVMFPPRNRVFLSGFQNELGQYQLYLEEYSWYNFWSGKEIREMHPEVLIIEISESREATSLKYIETVWDLQMISLFGDTYFLDSCILSNYVRPKNMGHAIAGITCNGEPFVFNGWRVLSDGTACPLQPFSWKMSCDSFTLSNTGCMIESPPGPNNIVFNFKRGRRLFFLLRDP